MPFHRFFFGLIFLTVTTTLSSCGLRVPDVQEPWDSPSDAQMMVNGIVAKVRCDLSETLRDLIEDDRKNVRYNHGVRKLAWLDDWGVQVTLNLTIDEQTSVRPGVAFNTPMVPANPQFPDGFTFPVAQSYSLGLGGNFSSKASRIDKLSMYYLMKDLMKPTPCSIRGAHGSLLLSNDLKLREWLTTAILPQALGTGEYPTTTENPFEQDVISHQITFEVVSGGSVTPTWSLIRVAANQGTTLFDTNRTRTHNLTITLGPTASKDGKLLPIPALTSANAHLASEIGLSVANNIRALGR